MLSISSASALSLSLLLMLLTRVVLADEFPEPLTLANFNTKLEHGLHLVEFFSPYCSHCKHLAPTWEKTWEDFHAEGETLGIAMAQVDCVSSGDLCNQEKITAYPAIKLYGPKGFLKNYPKGFKRTEQDFIRFMRDVSIDLADPNFHVASKSKYISTDALVKILGEKTVEPQLISFWPSYSLKDLDDYDKDKFDTSYDDECLDFQRTWSIVSNQVQTMGIQTGHFNCLSNKQICSKLNLSMKKPSVLLILPRTNVAKVIEFDQTVYEMTHKDITAFAKSVTEIAQFESTDAIQLMSRELVSSKLPLLESLSKSSEVTFVFVYDEETTTEEDFDLLPYLIEPLSKLPHTKLFKTNNTAVLELVEIQKKNVYRVLNYNHSEATRELNPQRNTIETMTTLPTLLAFKENFLMPSVFQSFAPNDIRDQYRVIDWLREVASPGYARFDSKSYKRFMNLGDKSSKLAILLLDTADETASIAAQYSFIVAAHDYIDIRNEARYQKIMEKRKLKDEEVELLKEKNAKSRDIVQALSEEIHYDNKGDLILAYMDIADLSLLKMIGIDVLGRDFNPGDVVVIERDGSYYYDRDSLGDVLSVRSSPYPFRQAMAIINGVLEGKIAKSLKHSPFPRSLKFMERLHGHGLVWYLVLAVVLGVMMKKGPSIIWRQKNRDNLGILGNPTAKVD